MSVKLSEKNMVLNADGITYRFPGVLQWQMSVADQKKHGLIATNSRSIRGRLQRKQGDINILTGETTS